MTASARCTDTLLGDSCQRLAGHDGLHKRGQHTWGFRDVSVPEWVARARAGKLPAKELVRP